MIYLSSIEILLLVKQVIYTRVNDQMIISHDKQWLGSKLADPVEVLRVAKLARYLVLWLRWVGANVHLRFIFRGKINRKILMRVAELL